jgi:protein-S-isoprenylcysteine O-methyltransferase Ste14
MTPALVVTLGVFAAMAGSLFISAGRCDLPAFWAYLAIMFGPGLLSLPIVHSRSPGLIEERLHPGPGERDRLTAPVVVLSMLTHWVIAGLDVGRFHWSGDMPLVVQYAGFVGYAIGLGLAMWATLVNRFFSSAVRIQADRGHYVITTGPYQYVRHPGYSGGLLFLLCSGLALGSWWSILPVLFAVADLIYRTRLEDQMLQRELPGYADYAEKVQHRLVPGLW